MGIVRRDASCGIRIKFLLSQLLHQFYENIKKCEEKLTFNILLAQASIGKYKLNVINLKTRYFLNNIVTSRLTEYEFHGISIEK